MTPGERLVEAVKAGDHEAVARALEAGADGCEARPGGVSVLLLALYHGHPAIADMLAARRQALDVFELSALGRGAELCRLLRRAPEEALRVAADGFTPLALAAFFCREGAVRALLDAGADPRQPSQNATRAAPLHAAVSRRCLSVARLLLDRGADANARQQGGLTPLHGAAGNGDRALSELLVERGADPSSRDGEGRRPHELATARGHPGLADWLCGILGG